MRAGILNAGSWIPGGVREKLRTEEVLITDQERARDPRWDLEEFEREQVRGLVRHVFFLETNPPVRQVVFSAIEPETDIRPLCKKVGELVAAETDGDVAFIDERHATESILTIASGSSATKERKRPGEPKAHATQMARNFFWLEGRTQNGDRYRARSLQLYLAELRQEFEYSIVAAPPLAISNESLAMAKRADGVVLVLSALHTRRVSALKVKNALCGARLLGTVLCEREFPIPSGIYRRL